MDVEVCENDLSTCAFLVTVLYSYHCAVLGYDVMYDLMYACMV